MSVRCGDCNLDRSDEDLIDRETNGVIPCPSCGSGDLTYTLDSPEPDPEEDPWDLDGLVAAGTDPCPRCEVAHTVYGVARSA